MTVGGAFVNVCEKRRVKVFEKQSRVYNEVRYNVFFTLDPNDRVIMESQCITRTSCEKTRHF